MRRCPDISKLANSAISRACRSTQGLKPTLDWYWSHAELAPKSLTRRRP